MNQQQSAMEENNNLEKIAKSAFDKFQMNPPLKAWDRLSSELDRHQEVVTKHKSDRTRLIMIAAMIFLASMLSWKLLNTPAHIVTTEKVIESSANTHKSEAEKPLELKSKSKNQDQHVTNTLPGTETSASIAAHQQLNQAPGNNKGDVLAVSPTGTTSNMLNTHTSDFNSINSSGLPDESYSSTLLIDSENILIPGIDSKSAYLTGTESVPLVLTHPNTGSLVKPLLPSPSSFSIAAYFSPNYTWQTLKDNTDNNIDDVSMYNDREKALFSFTAGINVLYSLNNNWSIVTGVSYTRNARSMSVPAIYAQMNSSNQMYFEYSTSNGVIEVPLDDSHNSMHPGDSIMTESKAYQYLKSVSIPVLIRYSIKKSKSTFYAEGGISTSFLVQSKAKMRIDDYEPTVINKNNGLKTTSFGYIAGIGAEHHFNPNLNFFIGPVFRGSFTSITKNSAVNTYPYSIGINVGMIKHF